MVSSVWTLRRGLHECSQGRVSERRERDFTHDLPFEVLLLVPLQSVSKSGISEAL